MKTTKAMPPTQKMKSYRERLRMSGLRPIQIWVPDTRSPAIAEELRRQSLLASAGPDEQATLDFLEAAADWDDWK